MKVSLKKSDTFIPDWQDNLDQPEEQQIKVNYRFLGAGERKAYVYMKPMEFTQEMNSGDGQIGKMEMVQKLKELTIRMVTSIENLEIEFDDGKTVAIDDIKEFYKYALPDLAALIEQHMLEATAVVDSKN